MADDSMNRRLFEMRLIEMYQKYSWLHYEIRQTDFLKLFKVHYKAGLPQLPEKPVGLDLDRELFLEIILAFRQSFPK